MAKQKQVKQWGIKLHQAADMFATRLSRADHLIHHDFPKLAAMLDRMLTALHAYVTVPTTETNNDDTSQS